MWKGWIISSWNSNFPRKITVSGFRNEQKFKPNEHNVKQNESKNLNYEEGVSGWNLQCCHVFPARSSAFFVASPTFLLHLPSISRTLTTVSDETDIKTIIPQYKVCSLKLSFVIFIINLCLSGRGLESNFLACAKIS